MHAAVGGKDGVRDEAVGDTTGYHHGGDPEVSGSEGLSVRTAPAQEDQRPIEAEAPMAAAEAVAAMIEPTVATVEETNEADAPERSAEPVAAAMSDRWSRQSSVQRTPASPSPSLSRLRLQSSLPPQ